MQTCARYSILVLGIIISLHFILRLTNENYGRVTSISNIHDTFKGSVPNLKQPEHPISPESPINDGFYGTTNGTLSVDKRANATFVILARNTDINGAIRSVRDIEDRFNKRYGYPYVFLNDVPFSDEFKKRVSVLSGSKMEFGLIPKEDWNQPSSIDEDKAKQNREKMVKENVIYGGSVAYRNMCRFNSGFFFKHELMQKYRWYWRIEPDVHFHCDIHYDPFLYMEGHNKTYSFTITMYEFDKTIPTLWQTVRDFMKENPQYIAEDNAMGFMSNDGGEHYNLCHFWSNFEIADMNFWRGEAYQAFFEYLDSKGGFYYERWGDAPVHSIAAALFKSKDQIHFFDDIGYEHNPYTHCPQSEKTWEDGRCSCDRGHSFDYDGYSCMKTWDKFIGKT